MYERAYGSKYVSGYETAAEIAKRMRGDIKDKIKSGELPGSMSNYSVRVDNFSGGRSINITAQGFEGMWEKKMVTSFGYEEEREVLTAEGARIEGILKAIHWSYNHDGSDSMTDYYDVNYYGHAEIESSWRARFRAEEKVRQAAKAARKAAAPAPKPMVLIPGSSWPKCSKPVVKVSEQGHRYGEKCGEAATVMQIGKQRYFPVDKARCDAHKRGACRAIVREEEMVSA